MKFNFKKKCKDVKVGDMIFSHASESYYMIVKEFTPSCYKYKLLCLNDATITFKSFECVDDILDSLFSSGQYDVIPNEDIVLSNSN